jgi:hypothetical protein
MTELRVRVHSLLTSNGWATHELIRELIVADLMCIINWTEGTMYILSDQAMGLILTRLGEFLRFELQKPEWEARIDEWTLSLFRSSWRTKGSQESPLGRLPLTSLYSGDAWLRAVPNDELVYMTSTGFLPLLLQICELQ